jgi:hypothetical protein
MTSPAPALEYDGRRWPPPGYTPEYHQLDMHSAAAKYRWLCSGIGGGKTAWGVIEDYNWCVWNPGIRGMMILPKFDAWQTTVEPECQRWWPEGTWECDWQKKQIIIDTGAGRPKSTIFLRSAWNTKQVQNILGPTLGFFHIDEAARMTLGEQVWRNVTGRLRQADVERRGGWITASPMGYGWLTDAFGIDTGLPETAYTQGVITKRDVEPDSGIETSFFVRGAETAWNTHNPPDYLASLLTVYGGDKRFLDQELRGRILSHEGMILHNFYRPLHVVPHAVAMEIFKRCKTFHGGMDWGETAPAAMTWGGTTKGGWRNGTMVIVGGYYQPQTEAEKLGALAWEITNKYRAEIPRFERFRWYCDPEDPASIRKLKTGFVWAGKNYKPVPGIIRPRDIPGKKWNQWKAGVDTMRILLGYVRKIDHPAWPEGNKAGGSRVYISDRVAPLIKEIVNWKQIPIEAGKPIREGAVGECHAIDTWRYQALGERMVFEMRPKLVAGF